MENRRFTIFETTKLQPHFSAIREKDRSLAAHCVRVARVSYQLARSLGLERWEAEEVRVAGLMHDFGKVFIPNQILQKPKALTHEEWNLMKEHPEKSFQELEQYSLSKTVLDGMRYHHEKWDGSGYPYGLSGEEIPLVSRIITVADAWDALLSKRSYKPGFTPSESLQNILLGSGTHFDPKIVDALCRTVGVV